MGEGALRLCTGPSLQTFRCSLPHGADVTSTTLGPHLLPSFSLKGSRAKDDPGSGMEEVPPRHQVTLQETLQGQGREGSEGLTRKRRVG